MFFFYILIPYYGTYTVDARRRRLRAGRVTYRSSRVPPPLLIISSRRRRSIVHTPCCQWSYCFITPPSPVATAAGRGPANVRQMHPAPRQAIILYHCLFVLFIINNNNIVRTRHYHCTIYITHLVMRYTERSTSTRRV